MFVRLINSSTGSLIRGNAGRTWGNDCEHVWLLICHLLRCIQREEERMSWKERGGKAGLRWRQHWLYILITLNTTKTQREKRSFVVLQNEEAKKCPPCVCEILVPLFASMLTSVESKDAWRDQLQHSMLWYSRRLLFIVNYWAALCTLLAESLVAVAPAMRSHPHPHISPPPDED